ncbi:MAG: hypothetical protein LIP08_14185 [Bacteroides sp.]|nr:hypothetical protein [Bacteroides sp.]
MKKRIVFVATTLVYLFISINVWSSEPIGTENEKSDATCRITMTCLTNLCTLSPSTYMYVQGKEEDFCYYRNSGGQVGTFGPDPRVLEVPLGASEEMVFVADVTDSDQRVSVYVNNQEVARLTEPQRFSYKIDTTQENVQLNFWFRDYYGN